MFLVLLFPLKIYSQVPSLSGGLAFSSGTFFESLTTGNPAVYARIFFKLNEKLKIAPSVTAFSPKKRSFPAESGTHKNLMFHGDVDACYSLFRDHPLRVVGFAGLNVTSIFSKWDVQDISNKTGIGIGGNIGLELNMFVDNSFDGFISGKYIAGTYSQFVINIGVVYYPEGLRRKGGW